MKLKLHWQILIALGLAVIVGLLTGKSGVPLSVVSEATHQGFYEVYDFLGTLFLNALKMLIVPLIVSSIITGVASTGGGRDFGRLGGKTLLYYMATSLIAILIGLTLINLTHPGIIDGQAGRHVLGLQELPPETLEGLEGKGMKDIAQIFIRMVPSNVFAAATDNGQMLGLIFFALLFGYFMMMIPAKGRELLTSLWQAVFDIMLRITELIMRFAPIGVFALLARTVSTTGFDAFAPLLVFFFTVLAALLLHFCGVLPLILFFVARVNPLKHFAAMVPALLTAFSTASSAATLPLTLECVEKRAGVSNRVTSFVLPLGATVNMDGTALFECTAAMFIAQAYSDQISLGFSEQFIIVVIALMTSIGVAAIPKASLVAIVVILAAIGLPAEALGLILAVDRILDMCRTSVNVFSDSVGAVVIAKGEGETGVLAA
jgi:proton glutamate symport protein